MIPPTSAQFLAALARTEQLVPAPRTLSRALQLLRNPDSGLDAIAELIRRDSALAVDVLRCANSAFYGRPARIADVGDAVQVIGFRETIRLVSLVAARQTTDRNLGSYGIAADDFWAESLFNGLLLESLAPLVPAIDPGEAYTAGLLRFVGRLAIDQALQELGAGLFWDGATPLADWERENVGLTQAEVGARLLRKWGFHEPIVLAIETQEGAAAGETAAAPLVGAMQFVARVLPAGRSLASLDALVVSVVGAPAQHPFAQAHGLTPDAVSATLRAVHRAFLLIRQTLYR